MDDIYSNLKAAYYIDRIAALRTKQPVMPVQVQLVISDLCNQDCNFCTHRISNGTASELFSIGDNHNPNRMIPTDKCIEILDDCRSLGVEAIQFTGGGEPTVHPDHLKIFEYAQKHFKTGLISNGFYLKDWDIYNKFDWIRISLDAACSETYQKIRKHSGFYTVVSNINDFSREYKGTLGVGFVVAKDNYNELYEAAKLAKDIGADYIRYGAIMSNSGTDLYSHGIEIPIEESITAASRDYADNKFKIHDLFTSRLIDLRSGSPDYDFCGYQYFTVYIGGDQKVYRCCTTSYTRHGDVGDLSKQRFFDWAVNAKRDFNAKSCSVCQFNDKNRVINYLLSQPDHVEFV